MKFERRLPVTFFLMVILIELFVLPLLLPSGTDFSKAWDIGIVISEDVLILPVLLLIGVWYFWNMWKECNDPYYESLTIGERLMFKPIKFRTFILTIIFSMVMSPIASLFNAISLLFTDNVILEQTNEIMNYSFPVTFFIAAVFGPLCEEVGFRGLVYGGFRRVCRPRAAILMSALMFGLMHLNFNQFGYAFALGVGMALIVEASGSIWTSIILHLLINGTSVVYMYLLDAFDSKALMDIAEQDIDSSVAMLPSIGILAVISLLMVWLATVILKKISKIENRDNVIELFVHSREYKGERIWTLPLIITIGIYLAVMIYDFIMGM